MVEKMDANAWQARAALCELLALSFRYPEPVLAEVVASGEWTDAAFELAAATGVNWEPPETLIGDVAAEVVDDKAIDTNKLLHSLRAEATHLFVGSPEPVVSPYEGVWRAADDGVDALLFVNPHSMDVERFCKACGLGRPEGTNEPLDYVATELELLEFLAARAAMDASGTESVSDAEGADVAMVASDKLPGGSAEAAFDMFMVKHAQLWMPRFAVKVQTESRIPFFEVAAQLLAASLKAMV